MDSSPKMSPSLNIESRISSGGAILRISTLPDLMTYSSSPCSCSQNTICPSAYTRHMPRVTVLGGSPARLRSSCRRSEAAGARTPVGKRSRQTCMAWTAWRMRPRLAK